MLKNGHAMCRSNTVVLRCIFAKEAAQCVFALVQACKLGPDLGQFIRGVKGYVLRCATRMRGLWKDKWRAGQWGANLFHAVSMGPVWLKRV